MSPYDCQNNITNIEGSNFNNTITISFRRKLITNDIFDLQFYRGRQYHVTAAYNTTKIFQDNSDAMQPSHTKYMSMIWDI